MIFFINILLSSLLIRYYELDAMNEVKEHLVSLSCAQCFFPPKVKKIQDDFGTFWKKIDDGNII